MQMGFFDDIADGIFQKGVNRSTFIALNGAFGAFVLALFLLGVAASASHPALVPHVAVMVLLTLGLWASIAWFCTTIGFQDSRQQQPAPAARIVPMRTVDPSAVPHQPYVSTEIEPASPIAKKDQ